MLLNKNKQITLLSTLLLMNLTTTLQLQAHTKTITKEDEFLCLIDQSKPTVVMGNMENCPHCKSVTPAFEDFSKKHPSIAFFKTNGPAINMHGIVKRESQGKGDFKIIGYPAFVFIKDKKIDSVLVGATPATLEKAIKDFEKNLKHKPKASSTDKPSTDKSGSNKSGINKSGSKKNIPTRQKANKLTKK